MFAHTIRIFSSAFSWTMETKFIVNHIIVTTTTVRMLASTTGGARYTTDYRFIENISIGITMAFRPVTAGTFRASAKAFVVNVSKIRVKNVLTRTVWIDVGDVELRWTFHKWTSYGWCVWIWSISTVTVCIVTVADCWAFIFCYCRSNIREQRTNNKYEQSSLRNEDTQT